jgi:cytochrome o ubiquinol oxidase subunit 2
MRKLLKGVVLLSVSGVVAGCNMVVLQPSGDVAIQQRNLLIASTALMLLIIIPVMVLTVLFAYHYRRSNPEAAYDPEWHHSTQLEVAIWTAPLVIIIALGAITWISTHTLDPSRALTRIAPSRPLPPDAKPLTIEVVALDWKWLFFYPEQGVASVNELAAPVNQPLAFKITASSVMNAFYVPALAGMIYAMPGMETKLHAVINKEGVYDGFSANYSGAGFSHMTFRFLGQSSEAFGQWVTKAKRQNSVLTREEYLRLERPSEREPVRYYSTVAEGIYDSILNMCVVPGKMCLSEMMQVDARGGAGVESRENQERLEYDNRHMRHGDEPPGATSPASGRPPQGDVQPQGMQPRSTAPQVREPGQNPPSTNGGNDKPDTTGQHNH